MSTLPLSVAEAARRMPYVSQGTLYRWVRSGEVKAERSPGGRMKIRESEVERINSWYEGLTAEPE